MLMEIDRCDNLSASDFYAKYLSRNYPVVLTGLAKVSRATLEWTIDTFSERYGAQIVEVTNRGERREKIRLSDYIARLADGDPNAGYLRDWKISSIDEKIFADIPALPHFSTDLLDHHVSTRNYLKEVFIGPPGSSTFLHVDVWQSHSWMLLLQGRKRWLMCPPGELERLEIKRGKNIGVFQAAVDSNLHQMNRLEFDLNPGEIVFVPSGWWHQVQNLSTSLAVTYNFIDAYSLERGYKIAEKNVRMFDEMVSNEIVRIKNLADNENVAEVSQPSQSTAFANVLEKRSAELIRRAEALSKQAAALRGIAAKKT